MITMSLLFYIAALALGMIVLFIELGKRDYNKWLESQEEPALVY